MATEVHSTLDATAAAGKFFVPGTCVVTATTENGTGTSENISTSHYDREPIATNARHERDPSLRTLYAVRGLQFVGRVLAAVDRNPYHSTYGCLDRQFWHYRTASFPSEMYQEGALTLALAYKTDMPDNRWFACPRVRELATAAIEFAARSSHANGSCDDYYPFERALGAAVFSLQAATRAYELLELDDARLIDWFRRRADWIIANDESGRLANHHALAALGLLRVGQITGQDKYRRSAEAKIATVLDWQHDEGWFDEYGGADPGYQTVTIDALAKIRRATGDASLDGPLRRAVAFAREFLHPDSSYGGEYGSRGTYHFYPHGMELFIADNPSAAADAAALADGFLKSLAKDTAARFDDDRLFAHQAANLLEAYIDWAPRLPVSVADTADDAENQQSESAEENRDDGNASRYYPAAQILVRRDGGRQTVVSAARGGIFKHFQSDSKNANDAGLIVETADGRVAVSQRHYLGRKVEYQADAESLSVSGPLHWVRHETVGPLKQAAFHVGMCFAGRWCRGLVRRLLQRRLITGLAESGIWLTRRFEFQPINQSHNVKRQDNGHNSDDGYTLRVIDTIELIDPTLNIRHMSFGSDHQTAYVAACGAYQDSLLTPWIDLSAHVEQLNARRRVTICREL